MCAREIPPEAKEVFRRVKEKAARHTSIAEISRLYEMQGEKMRAAVANRAGFFVCPTAPVKELKHAERVRLLRAAREIRAEIAEKLRRADRACELLEDAERLGSAEGKK